MRRVVTVLLAIAVVLLAVCAIGNALLGDWGSVALSAVAALLILLQKPRRAS